MSEEMVIDNCSPTLAGIKTGSLFSCAYGSREEIFTEVRRLNHLLAPRGLRVLVLSMGRTGKRALILVFRPASLEKDLRAAEAAEILRERGYDPDDTRACIRRLRERIRDCEVFPHEIGLFLGYPVWDVRGFIEKGSRQCLFSGLWKVYADRDGARKRFNSYRRCTRIYRDQFRRGEPLEKLAVGL